MVDSREKQWQTSDDQDKIKLLRLESEFYRSCNVIRQNGVELQKLRSCLVQELLDLERRKRIKTDKKLNERIEELQVRAGPRTGSQEKKEKENYVIAGEMCGVLYLEMHAP